MQFYIALLLLISAGAASAQLQKLDRRQAVRYALQNSPSFNSARNEREVADLTVKSSFWALFPSLDFTASYGLQDDDPSTYETPYTSQLALSLTETLYDNGVLLTQNKIANLARRRAELIFRKEKNRLVREVLEAYMKFSLQSRNLEVKEIQLDLIRRQYNLVSSAYKQGLKTRKDFLRFKTQLNRTQLDMVNARNSVEKTRLDLLKAIGVQPPQYTAFSFITEPVPT
ncbi:MAG: TolC family protein, partial [Bdellovibrionota bacterium]